MAQAEAKGISIQWIAISVVVIVFLNRVLIELISPSFAETFASMGATGIYLLVGLVAFVSFFLGGLIVGWFSPGETIKEPAIAGAAAVVINALIVVFKAEGAIGAGIYIQFAVTAAVGFVMALAGAWVGEKLQGDTLDKMRERGEFGNDVKT